MTRNIKNLVDTTTDAAAKRKEGIKAQKSQITQYWKQLKPLSQLTKTNWTVVDWSHFSTYAESSEKEKTIIIEIANKMLGQSYWIPVDIFFEVFLQWGLDDPGTEVHVNYLAENIAANGWQGIPFVSFFTEDKLGKVQLDSGHHRWIALKRLREQGKLDADFRVPVFDLRLMPKCVHKSHKADAEDAAICAEEGDRSMALSIYSHNWVLSCSTGIDY